MSNKIIITTIGVIAVLSFSVGYLFRPAQSVINQTVGSVTGPELFNNSWTVNGVKHLYARKRLTSATTTPCAISGRELGVTGTSTLIYWSDAITSYSDSGATTYDASISSTAYATTTSAFITGQALASGAQDAVATFLVGTSTSAATNQLLPSSFVTMKFSTSSLSTNFAITGSCQAEAIQI